VKFLKELFNVDRLKMLGENEKIRKNKKRVEQDIEELKEKYIKLLEEKCENYDKHLYWEEQAKEYADKYKEVKKELALTKEKIKSTKD